MEKELKKKDGIKLINSLEDLGKIKEEFAELIKMREINNQVTPETKDNTVTEEKLKGVTHQIMVCRGTGCASSGSREIREALKEELKITGLQDQVNIVETGCFGFCRLGPIAVIYPEGTFYCELKEEDAKEIVHEHIINGQVVENLLYEDPETKERVHREDQIEFFKHQKRVALRNCGVINPMVIEEYIARDGYFALGKALKGMSSKEVIQELKKSGLRGRGGGGFPTGLKWEFTAGAPGDVKFVVCNADEGDPGAFMDRSILEGDPHAVLEAMTIAGFAIGAKEGFIYVRSEYPIAVERLQIAIDQAKERGLLGKNILGSDFDFNIELRLGAGAFVCGEETALLRSIQGFRGEPRPRPPFPAINGLWAKPTLVNNVETYSNIPQIINKGSEWYASIGTEKSKGTKVFAIAGKIANTGLIEVPMGTTLRKVIYDIGGGIPDGKKFKAAQTGGPSGGCLPEQLLDISIEYDTLLEAGSMMGSGGLIIMDESDCMVDIVKFYLGFTRDESCGKCPPCRIGNRRLLEILEKISDGKATERDLELLEELAHNVRASSLCGLGQSSPNPILSTLRYFKDEYMAHIVDKRCPAGVCKALLSYRIQSEKCKTCGLCKKACPVEAITGEPRAEHKIDPEKCIKCGACVEKCKFKAITR